MRVPVSSVPTGRRLAYLEPRRGLGSFSPTFPRMSRAADIGQGPLLRGSRAPCGCQWAALPSRRAEPAPGHMHHENDRGPGRAAPPGTKARSAVLRPAEPRTVRPRDDARQHPQRPRRSVFHQRRRCRLRRGDGLLHQGRGAAGPVGRAAPRPGWAWPGRWTRRCSKRCSWRTSGRAGRCWRPATRARATRRRRRPRSGPGGSSIFTPRRRRSLSSAPSSAPSPRPARCPILT